MTTPTKRPAWANQLSTEAAAAVGAALQEYKRDHETLRKRGVSLVDYCRSAVLDLGDPGLGQELPEALAAELAAAEAGLPPVFDSSSPLQPVD
ncbi:hypothetical protein [Botrimarina sp.]|uniref:hypothetical protein n=1 Tax=Botrimarina sp. TaxID=2795802 RepID=UPI0032ED8A8B